MYQLNLVSKLDERFNIYDNKNPQVYSLFKNYSYQMIKNKKHYSAKTIMEKIRWDFDIKTKDSKFKINNSFTSRYARKLIKEDKNFEDFFELRELKS